MTKMLHGELWSTEATTLHQTFDVDATPDGISSSHPGLAERYYMFDISLHAFRPLPWPSWIFVKVFTAWVHLVDPFTLFFPAEPSILNWKVHMNNNCILIFDPGITLVPVIPSKQLLLSIALFLHKEELLKSVHKEQCGAIVMEQKNSSYHLQNDFFVPDNSSIFTARRCRILYIVTYSDSILSSLWFISWQRSKEFAGASANDIMLPLLWLGDNTTHAAIIMKLLDGLPCRSIFELLQPAMQGVMVAKVLEMLLLTPSYRVLVLYFGSHMVIACAINLPQVWLCIEVTRSISNLVFGFKVLQDKLSWDERFDLAIKWVICSLHANWDVILFHLLAKAAILYDDLHLLADLSQNILLLLSIAFWWKHGNQAGHLGHDGRSIQNPLRASWSPNSVQIQEYKHKCWTLVPRHGLVKWGHISSVVEQVFHIHDGVQWSTLGQVTTVRSMSKSWHGLLMNRDGVEQIVFNIRKTCVQWDLGDHIVALASISSISEEACKIAFEFFSSDKGKQYTAEAFCELSQLTMGKNNNGIPWDPGGFNNIGLGTSRIFREG